MQRRGLMYTNVFAIHLIFLSRKSTGGPMTDILSKRSHKVHSMIETGPLLRSKSSQFASRGALPTGWTN